MSEHKAKRLSKGHYLYRGFEIICVGYYEPEHHIAWEAVDKNGCGFAHSFSLKETKAEIDWELDSKN